MTDQVSDDWIAGVNPFAYEKESKIKGMEDGDHLAFKHR